MRVLVLFLAVGVLLTPNAVFAQQNSSSSTAEPESSDPFLQPVQLTLADLLLIYSELVTAQLRVEVVDEEAVESISVVLLSKDKKTVLDMVVSSEVIEELQGEAPGKQMKELLDWHRRFSRTLKNLDFFNVDRYESSQAYPTPVSMALASFLRGQKPEDVVIALRFKHKGTTHVYAEVRDGDVDFNPEAPEVR